MNPIKLSENLQKALTAYLTTTFDVNRDGQERELAVAIRRSFDTPGALFNGPYLELTPPYRTGVSLNQLCTEGVLSKKLLDMQCFRNNKPIPPDAPLYIHQETAIRKLSAYHDNVVISSGTGSGKTECFLIPILNDLLIDPTPGVRALLIYPMNALVNDQLDRLRNLLKDTDITFGRYTSELETTEQRARQKLDFEPMANEVISREQIRSGEKLPQILITNYAMLEYLLLRPEDSILFQNGLWRFIVLDEAHTYAGAQGIEVSYLLRRLKHRLNLQPGETRCIATSATLTDDDAEQATSFASALFGETFSEDDVVFGEIDEDYIPESDSPYTVEFDAYLDNHFDNLLEEIRGSRPDTVSIAIKMQDMGLIPESALDYANEFEDNPAAFLWNVLRANRDLTELRQWMMTRRDDPVRVDVAGQKIFGTLDADSSQQALYHLIELGSIARLSEDDPPLLPARYHLFVRPPQGIWVCLNLSCPGRDSSASTGWSKLYSARREHCDSCGCHVYPLTVCRTCGQPYIRMEEQEHRLVAEADELLGIAEARYFTWKEVEANQALGEEDDEIIASQAAPQSMQQERKTICLKCGLYTGHCNCDEPVNITLFLVNEVVEKQLRGTKHTQLRAVSHMNECFRCHGKSYQDTEIVTPISIYGTTPLSVLTYELYRQLPPSNNERIRIKPGEGRKLLSFYDSRQGAARFAAFLQDAVNQQTYRHIIPTAVRRLQGERSHLPDLQEVSRVSTDLAWEYHIFHNDATITDFNRQLRSLSSSERERLSSILKREVVAEFTTRWRQRQSLEAIGLIAVEYFEPGKEPDFEKLATTIGLMPIQCQLLVEYLLDSLRHAKVVSLPDGVARDDPVFGRNQFSPRLVKTKPGSHEIAWIGETPRHSRRTLVRTMLERNALPSNEEGVTNTLLAIWDWLLQETDLLIGSPSDGYQIQNNRLFFDAQATWYRCTSCQRLNYRGIELPCPHPNCGGKLEPLHDFEEWQQQNFYYQIFNRKLIPIRVEEHTAQLDSSKGRQYQEEFRDGEINALSCSTTFEMGIDLGDLQAIVMSNVPPTVANYRQRAGRAGRRASGTAFILTWASDRPHDQTYFSSPADIIRGQVRVPKIELDNQFIRRRHINAILLSAFLRYRRTAGHEDLNRIGSFFDVQEAVGEPHYQYLEKWLELRQPEIITLLDDFNSQIELGIEDAIRELPRRFVNELGRVNEHYQRVSNYYRREIEVAAQSIPNVKPSERGQAIEIIERYNKLLERLNNEKLIDYLSGRGVLPSYSFPLYTVELLLPYHVADTEHLRLQRDLKQAIREYAPGSEVVADKRIWRSGGLLFFRETPQVIEYRICEECNHLEISDTGIPLSNVDGMCSVCGTRPSKHRRGVFRFVVPDGFKSDTKRSGIAAGQYVHTEPSLMRSALIPRRDLSEEKLSENVFCSYDRKGELLYVNEGMGGRGFKICLMCGQSLPLNATKCKGMYRGKPCPGNRLEVVTLGHRQQTDTLHLRFASTLNVGLPSAIETSFWLSLMYALLQGASRSLQIERRDIDGVLFPRSVDGLLWEQTIVLFDNVPGGAGHVKRIKDEFRSVLEEAAKIVNCVECAPDTSCYHCLRDYSNQIYHSLLKRGDVARFLDALLASLRPTDTGIPGEGFVSAINLPRWLMRQVELAQRELLLAADFVTLDTPMGENLNWLDVIQNLLQRNVETHLFLSTMPGDDAASLSIARHLQVLIDRGLRLWSVKHLPDWQVIIDAGDSANGRAIRRVHDVPFVLDQMTGTQDLSTTIHPEGVIFARQGFEHLAATAINENDLDPPPNVRVINLAASLQKTTEADLFADVFAVPVRKLYVHDPYLFDRERIVKRLGAYIELAFQRGGLERVEVVTKRAGYAGTGGSPEEQDRAITELNQSFGNIVNFSHAPRQIGHDRYIEIERVDGTQARILIGQGLDFIQRDGTTRSTYIVIQDPF